MATAAWVWIAQGPKSTEASTARTQTMKRLRTAKRQRSHISLGVGNELIGSARRRMNQADPGFWSPLPGEESNAN